jgi:hypothetical protein
MQKELPFKFFENLINGLMKIIVIFKKIFSNTNKIRTGKVTITRKSTSSSNTLEETDNLRKVSNLNKRG